MIERDVPVKERVFGEGHYLRPQFIQPYRCQNVLIQGVSIKNSPMWEIHPVLCRSMIVRGVHINSHGPNNDGCDPESCTDVLIESATLTPEMTASRLSQDATVMAADCTRLPKTSSFAVAR